MKSGIWLQIGFCGRSGEGSPESQNLVAFEDRSKKLRSIPIDLQLEICVLVISGGQLQVARNEYLRADSAFP
ncbi:hypothetical protein [Pseudovibrio sp. Tun.PSC04-5.I4]|uniref:hypothetical protein n=1 Tax=Pseudovibrio sp. Tun.PSC04-5.I4 TaxID=1798213 RepID=UPI000882AF56|nr:hypothetical protein [Pseudovibrio sp. Tun.PSC04-5.I4]SDR08248.1 hypothetical protein SAMN04515695_2661 [Pseudovibrio sp. Tun.PSC04-5.I4]